MALNDIDSGERAVNDGLVVALDALTDTDNNSSDTWLPASHLTGSIATGAGLASFAGAANQAFGNSAMQHTTLIADPTIGQSEFKSGAPQEFTSGIDHVPPTPAAINYIYTGEPMTGTADDDFFIAFKGSTGTDNNTVNGNGGDDLVIGDSSDTYIPNGSYNNGSIGTAFSLETLTSPWTTAENEMFGDWTIPHATVIAEATIGQSEYYKVAIGAGQQITIDIDFASSTAIGKPQDLVVELQDSLGNIITTADDSLVTDGGDGSFPATAGSKSSYDPYLVYTVPSAGNYYINVRPFGGGPGSTFTDNNTFVMNVSVTGHAVNATNPVQGDDTINGGDGDDALFGQGGSDTINGNGGNDFIDSGSGGDIVHGGDGNDTIIGGDGTEENIHGDGGDDILISGGEGHYYGDDGNDIIYAGLTSGVNEILDGGPGIDTVDTTTWNGSYTINMATGVTSFGESFINFENITMGNGADTVTGTADANVIKTGAGIDSIMAGGGDDIVSGGGGGDTMDGGPGSDILDYRTSPGAVTVNLTTSSASGGDAAGDVISNFEGVYGSVLGDALTGDSNDNTLFGFFGIDAISGLGGNDVISGGPDGDTLDGGAGFDTLDYASSGTGVTINLATNSASGGDAAGDVISNFEGVIGSNLADTLTGSSGDNTLRGLGGNDIITGGSGTDTAVYTGALAEYNIVRQSDGTLRIADSIGSRDGTDLVGGVEQFIFADGTKSVGQAAEITNFNVFWHHDGTDDWRDWTMTAGTPVSHLIGGSPTVWDLKATGDFNGDGTSDAVWVNTSTGDFRALTYAPDGSLSSVNLLATLPTDWVPIATGDFNGDGTSDILLEGQSTGDIRIWNMSNGNVVSTSLLAGGGLPPDWRVTGSGDFNADGKYDLILKNTSTGEIREWLLNGGTIIQNNVLGSLGSTWGIAAVGDFNHDHTADILWRNTATGDTREWQMSGGAVANNVILPAASSDWHYIATGDFDQNGTDDLILQNVSSGEVREWLLDGNGNLFANIVLGALPSGWTGAVTGATHADYLGFI